MYAVGRIRNQPRVSHVGMDLIQSLVISEGLTQTLKYTTRRERPDHSGKNSFPSGHAADTFAFATALERHLGWRYAIPAYAFASYVAISRLPANRHWFSDAVFGVSRHHCGSDRDEPRGTSLPGGRAPRAGRNGGDVRPSRELSIRCCVECRRTWWPAFCLAYDVTAAGAMIWVFRHRPALTKELWQTGT